MGGVVKGMRMAGRPLCSALAVVAVISGSTVGARAQDIGDFFGQIFGGGSRPSVQSLPQPDGGMPDSPPLTVRAKKHRRPSGAQFGRSAKRYTPEELKSVTIYTDRTLVRGDAVMTRAGLRIFNGSPSWPHTEGDFVAISSADKLNKSIRKELSAIDVASRSDFRGN